jgi:hypothetical protein
MNDLTPHYERQTGQVFLDGLPAGAAGEAPLVPVPGLELAFDRADGHLSQVVVDAGGADGVSAPTAAILARLLGEEAPGLVHQIATGPAQSRVLSPEPGLCVALSRLARHSAARATSPVSPNSPWWAAEAAGLAERAGLAARARGEARSAVLVLAETPEWATLPEQARRTALAAADIAAADEPEAVGRVRERVGSASPEPVGSWLVKHPGGPGLDVAAEVECLEKDQVRLPGLHWVLDPHLVPVGLFRPGLSPHSDLFVRYEAGAGRVIVEALLVPGAECAALGSCQARLVDPDVRRVLAYARFAPAGSRARAELALPFRLDELPGPWIEVVDDEHRPVHSAKGHRIRRALRWADAALRAERTPAGLAPRSSSEDWAALAAMAWDRCRRDWEAAGDGRHAELVGPTPLQGPAYLAEVLGR